MFKKKITFTLQLLVLIAIIAVTVSTYKAEASEVIKGEAYWLNKLNTVRGPADSFKTSIRLSSFNGEKLIQESDLDIFFNGNENVLIAFRSPALDVGRKILVNGNNMWLATPTSQRVLRIHPTQRLVGASSNVDAVNYDFSHYELLEESTEVINENKMFNITLAAKDHNQPYQKIKFQISYQTHKPVLSHHYAASGKLLKIINYEAYKDGLISQLRTVDPINQSQTTLMTYLNYEVTNFPPAIFKKSNLKELTL